MKLIPALDLFPLMAAILAAMICGLLGNFLVLRRQSLMGDAISHAVLPGLIAGFLLTSSMSTSIMLVGAAIAGVLAVVLIELVRKVGGVEPGAAMGVVFSVMFAGGVLLLEQAAARSVHLDPDCVLYGQLETLVWYQAPPTFAGLSARSTVEAIPRQVWLLMVVGIVSLVFVVGLFKELRISSFDPGLSTAQGIHAGFMHYALMLLVAAATVASFEAVGSILVIAMLIAPAAVARLLTDRLVSQIGVSMIAAVLCAVLGYTGATIVPGWFDADSVNAAGSMTVIAGLLVFLAAVLSPRHGIVSRKWRQRLLARSAAIDDLLATLYRLQEAGRRVVAPSDIALPIPGKQQQATRLAVKRGLVAETGRGLALTDLGLDSATRLVRKHRLWEDYLVRDVGLEPDHVHETAEQLEHLKVSPDHDVQVDPHGSRIPPG
ncbi:MAG: metal ABC transporter permease [Planctomycetota bacterium]